METPKKEFVESHKKLVDDRLQQKKNGKNKGYIIEDKKYKRNNTTNVKSNKVFENKCDPK